MAKEFILMADVKGLGKLGDVVRVHDGYSRNYLIPNKLAAPVTDATRRQLDKKRKEQDVLLAQQKEAAKLLAQTVEKASCTITVKTGEGGKLFGSVTLNDIVKVLKGQGLELDKGQIEMVEPIKALGVFNLPVKLHPDVQATLKVWVVEE